MPNIFKGLRDAAISRYVFQEMREEPPEPEPVPVEAASAHGAEEAPAPPKPKEVLDFAKVQAEELLADAHRQAEELLKNAREEARSTVEQAEEEARAEGYRQGFAEGLKKAQLEGQTELEAQMSREAEEVAAFLQQASDARDTLLAQAEEELKELSLTIAEKIIQINLESQLDVLVPMVQEATEYMKRREWVHVYVGGCTGRELASVTPELTRVLESVADHVKLIPMPEDERGTCIIDLPDVTLDASVSTQLANVRELLRDR